MKRFLFKSLWLLVHAVVALVGGWYLAHALTDCLCEMPLFLETSIRGALRLIGIRELDNPLDIEVLELYSIFVMCTLLVGAVLWVGNLVWRRCRIVMRRT